jgi:solute carrier family 25 (mitochondrial citrate transporter), member 1
MAKIQGVRALYKGLTPRVMRVAPGQAVTFMVLLYDIIANVRSMKKSRI